MQPPISGQSETALNGDTENPLELHFRMNTAVNPNYDTPKPMVCKKTMFIFLYVCLSFQYSNKKENHKYNNKIPLLIYYKIRIFIYTRICIRTCILPTQSYVFNKVSSWHHRSRKQKLSKDFDNNGRLFFRNKWPYRHRCFRERLILIGIQQYVCQKSSKKKGKKKLATPQ